MAFFEPRLPTLDEYDTSSMRNFILKESTVRPHAHTPCIVTLCERDITPIDIQSFIHMGLRILRFKMHHITNEDKIKILAMVDEALKLNKERSGAPVWPISIILDIPNACIKTGYLKKEITDGYVVIKDNWIVEVTCDSKHWDQCEAKTIYIDDPYTFQAITVGTEITIDFGRIIMVCVKVIDKMTIECIVKKGEELRDLEFVCIRGVKHTKPPFSKEDLALLQLAYQYNFDIITINSVRNPYICLQKIRKMFKDQPTPPLILCSICEQEGLDNIDEILKFCDGIILAREFLAYAIDNIYKLPAIQLQISAKCRQIGKPFFISGNILENTLQKGVIKDRDVNDVTNAIIQGSGFILRDYKKIRNVLNALRLLNDICRHVETLKADADDIWRITEEIKMPSNAAKACIVSCAFVAKQIAAVACVVVTVTGTSAVQLCHMAHGTIILAITRNPIVARQLQIYKGIVPILYSEPPGKTWYDEIIARVKYAAYYGLHYDILKYGDQYVALRKSESTSCFCDHISIWTVHTEKQKRGFHYFNI